MNDAGRIGGRRRIITTPIIGSITVRTLSRRKPGIINIVVSILKSLTLTSGIIKGLIRLIKRRDKNMTVSTGDFIQNRMPNISTTVVLVSSKQVALSQ